MTRRFYRARTSAKRGNQRLAIGERYARAWREANPVELSAALSHINDWLLYRHAEFYVAGHEIKAKPRQRAIEIYAPQRTYRVVVAEGLTPWKPPVRRLLPSDIKKFECRPA
jgi:hypothetical protein